MKVIKTMVWPVFMGLLTAFIVMLLFEYVNSFFYPLPEGLNWNDANAVRAFTLTLPWTAYILVLCGWAFGSFDAGYVTTYLSREQAYKRSLFVGILLVILGVVSALMIGYSLWVSIIGLPLFVVGTYLGHRYQLTHRG